MTPFGSGFGEPSGHHDEPPDALRRTVPDDVRDRAHRHRDHREVDRSRNVADRRVSGDAGDGVGNRVDRKDPTGEPNLDEIANEHVADLVA